MSPGKPARAIKVHVPRHNSQRIGPALTNQVQTLAKEQGVRVNVRQSAPEQSSALALAIESASEWNSLLITARAERGPQWDCGTQQFLADEGSELYYNPTPLLETVKNELGGSNNEESGERSSMQPDTMGRSPSTQRGGNVGQYPYNMPISPATSSRAGGYPAPASPYGAAAPGQYYGDGNSPVKMGYSQGDYAGRRMTRGMGDDGFPAYGN
ncbi:hypothetical protein NEOLEDRAFT_1182777 [Neolentinus lepideus HHB14362 ss-1]|uniref:Uncharacterized protein n=1 Tax=Neolentinus lepideus HHB14362 ss-1 TaxID=1314782 RepID=A0A165NUZ7_9AGAM|nr:hypothetical protein NEOLEDRAFT_1182777 [Neolentinus lepideus HHB14362 ss-1]